MLNSIIIRRQSTALNLNRLASSSLPRVDRADRADGSTNRRSAAARRGEATGCCRRRALDAAFVLFAISAGLLADRFFAAIADDRLGGADARLLCALFLLICGSAC